MSRDVNETGVVLFAHGSRVEEANQGVRDLTQQVRDAGPYRSVFAAFLELAEPSLSAAVAQAVEAGLGRVIIIPYFLTEGTHLRRDLPKLVEPLRQKYPALGIDLGQSLDGHPQMPSIILGRVREVVEECGRDQGLKVRG
jgi:sirohydrochlorin ferrochelatase